MTHETWDTDLYDQKHAFVSAYGKGVITLLEPQAGEVILDLGCGTGHLAKTIAESGARVTGIDSSAEMIESAQRNYPELDFRVADASNFSFPDPFDAIFSNATLHWVLEAEKAVACIAAALKTGGRLVMEMGGKGNIATIIAAVQQAAREQLQIEVESGWYFPAIGEYTGLLERHGLQVQTAILFARPTRLDGEQGLRNWIAMFGGRLLQDIPEEKKKQILDRAEELAYKQLWQEGVWVADYKRLRIVAYKI